MIKSKKINCKTCKAECWSGKRGLCDSCHKKEAKAKAKVAKVKEKVQKKKALQRCSKEALLRDIQKLVRLTQPPYCFICKEPYQGTRIANGSHLLSRQYSATCFYAGNLSSGCNYCNSNTRTAGEQFFHSIEMDKLYGAGHSETIFRMGKIGYKWSRAELSELRELVDKYLNLVNESNDPDVKQSLWLAFKAEQEQMDFFQYLQKELK